MQLSLRRFCLYPTGCISDGAKDEFYRKLSILFQKVIVSGVVIASVEFTASVGDRLSQTEKCLGSLLEFQPSEQIAIVCLLYLALDNHLFLESRNFRHN